VYFYNLAHDLGIDRMHEFMAKFGFGLRTGLDSTGERSGLLPSREWKRRARREPWYPGETLIAGIGQGAFNVTPIQLSAATSTMAMKGLHVRPHLLKAIMGPDGTVIEEATPEVINRVELNHPEHWDMALLSMFNVVNSPRGTAYRIGRDAGYDIAGKTGTAQVFGIAQDEEYDEEKIAKKLRDHALFLAFAPFENPAIALAVIVENGGSGGAVAGPIARAVMDHYLGVTGS
jgi:penicillin-binding protein 2